MSEPVLSIILLIGFFVALTATSWFKTLDGALWRDARVPLVAGVVCGVIIHFFDSAVVTGVLLTLAALYVRLTGRESEPSDGMILGAMTGAAAVLPLVILDADVSLLRFAACVLAGAGAGYGITFGLTHVRNPLRQLGVDAMTAAIAIGAAALPALLIGAGMGARSIAVGAGATVPLLVLLTVFKQWPAIRSELRQEAALGVLDDADVGPTAHPLRRLTRAGWHNPAAHREFVRIASRIALRKRQQRGRVEELARLYQLEVIKLRMELQETMRIDRAMRAAAAQKREQQQPAR